MDRLKEKRLLEALEKLKKSVVKRSILLSAKFNERLGKIKQKYPGARFSARVPEVKCNVEAMLIY